MSFINLGIEFYRVSKANADRPAIRFPDRTYSYRELNSISNQIARSFLERGLKVGSRISITSQKDIGVFASIVAALKIGATYSVVDRKSPVERLDKIIQNFKPDLVLVDDELERVLKGGSFSAEQIHLNRLIEDARSESEVNLSETSKFDSSQIAYVMYTSGSTGTPKGVAIPHRNVLAFRDWGVAEYQITPADTLTQLNSLFFDNSVFDLYMSLFSGASILPLGRDDLKDPHKTVQILTDKEATLWFSVPSLLVYLLNLHVLTGSEFNKMRGIIFGGEGFPKNKLKELFDLYSPRIQLHNVYGPTECTCICSSYPVKETDFTDMQTLAPLGHLAQQFFGLVLADDGSPAKVDEVGELYLGGPCVGAGYFADPERTQSAFIQNPTHANYIDIVYRTGDFVKTKDDGNLYFVGRRDQQIKFMGYRIELGEIESAFSALEYVKSAVVTFGQKNGHPEIAAHLEVQAGASEAQLRKDLTVRLPSYMIPRKFCFYESLPKNPNGKVDRRMVSEKYYG